MLQILKHASQCSPGLSNCAQCSWNGFSTLMIVDLSPYSKLRSLNAVHDLISDSLAPFFFCFFNFYIFARNCYYCYYYYFAIVIYLFYYCLYYFITIVVFSQKMRTDLASIFPQLKSVIIFCFCKFNRSAAFFFFFFFHLGRFL